MNEFIQKLMSGADNITPAIGRYLAAFLFINALTIFPAVIIGSLLLQGASWAIWSAFLTSLSIYIPSSVAGIVALIRVTAPTEPDPIKGDKE
jgi:hypothetical protein